MLSRLLSFALPSCSLSQGPRQVIRDIKTKLPIVARVTTRERWTDFEPYTLDGRGENNVPIGYIKTAEWATIRDFTGYYVHLPHRPAGWYPVEFNTEHTCWTRVERNTNIPADESWEQQWNVLEPAPREYGLDIYEEEILRPESRASTTSSSEEEESSEEDKQTEEQQPDNILEEFRVAEITGLAESITIHKPAAMVSRTGREERLLYGYDYAVSRY